MAELLSVVAIKLLPTKDLVSCVNVFPPEGMLKCCKIQLFALGGSSALDVVVMRMDTLVDWGLITAALQLKLCWPTI